MRKFAAEQGIHNYDINEGVCHQVVLEKGRAAPGEIIVGADSHTCMYGAVGAFATGIGSTDMGFALKFGALYFKVPETIRAEVSGKFRKRVGAKDLILAIAADIGADGATYQAIEFTGKTIAKMDMPGRMTCCNMAIEMGAKAGIVPPDKVTWAYMKGRRKIKPFDLASDDNAKFAEKRTYDVSDLEPQVAVPHNVDQGVTRSARLPGPVLTRSLSARAQTGVTRISPRRQKCWAKRSLIRGPGCSSSPPPVMSISKRSKTGL